MYDPADPDQAARVKKVVYDMVDRGLDMEGSCTVRVFSSKVPEHSLTHNHRVSMALD